jgi:hypothetical protein
MESVARRVTMIDHADLAGVLRTLCMLELPDGSP